MAIKKHNLWYKDAIIYQLHVRSFFDSNNDGIGDFKGLIKKLDYLKNLGINAIWLLPFYQSPLKDGGYDISDFTNIHPSYGTLADFKRFVKEAHQRDLKVITELVLNHTSNEHNWFQRARNAKPGSKWREFYVWNDNSEKYSEARVIFQDFESSNWTWDPVAESYYWHRFYSHQPDLNFENESVKKALFKVIDFWFKIGVDGLRLDAVPYLYEREGTNCENLPETHNFLKDLRKYVDDHFENKMLLAEANQWPDDASAYFGEGNECHMAFHFPLMPRLYMAMRMEDRFPVIDILEQTPEIPENCQWSIFLRNHDELTLEMVSDEERDYMYKSYAKDPKQRVNLGIRRRLAPLLENDRKNIELLNILLFSLPGTPIVYYGDELGMGDNYYLGDRDGVRTPMQWSSDKNAGFSEAEPQRLFLPIIYNHDYHYESINVENQERNSSSLLWWMRRVISLRRQYQAFSRGTIKYINTGNPKILAFVRSYQQENLLVLINLSRYSQVAQLDLSEFKGFVPREVFGKNEFPVIGKELYTFPMQFKNYFWFELYKSEKETPVEFSPFDFQIQFTSQEWNRFNVEKNKAFSKALLNYVQKSRWFRGKARKIKNITIKDRLPVTRELMTPFILIVQINYIEDKQEQYVIPVSLATREKALDIRNHYPESVIASVEIDHHDGLLYDGSYDEIIRERLFALMMNRGKIKGEKGELTGLPGKKKILPGRNELPLPSKILSAEQSNTSILYDNRYFFKIYRALEEGYNPELELIRELTDKTKFENFPSYAGTIEYCDYQEEQVSVGILMKFVPNEGNAWEFTQSAIDRFFEKIISRKDELKRQELLFKGDYDSDNSELLEDLIGNFFIDMVTLLGKRTAEMHLSLADIKGNRLFQPEPFSLLYQKSMYQSFRTLVKRTFDNIKQLKKKLPSDQSELVSDIIENEGGLLSSIKHSLEASKIHSAKTRVHGDYHLGQVLFTGKDFIIIDFEGEPTRSLTARKLKYCPFKDISGMLRSFHYAIYMGYFKHKAQIPEDSDMLEPWLEIWYDKIKSYYVDSYLQEAGNAIFIPKEKEQIDRLLDLFLIEKAVYEADYELNNRPDWLIIPLNGLKKITDNMTVET